MPTPKPDLQGIKKFKQYKDKGLSYNDISKLLGKEVRTLTRWNKYLKTRKITMDNLSTV